MLCVYNFYLHMDADDRSANVDVDTNTIQTVDDVLLQLENTKGISRQDMCWYVPDADVPVLTEHDLYYSGIRSWATARIDLNGSPGPWVWSDTTSSPGTSAHINQHD